MWRMIPSEKESFMPLGQGIHTGWESGGGTDSTVNNILNHLLEKVL
jgi:hypothetical protein